jgi:hypothetical protein
MTGLSIKFSSSRTFPGHDQFTMARIVWDDLPMHLSGVFLGEVPREHGYILGVIALTMGKTLCR